MKAIIIILVSAITVFAQNLTFEEYQQLHGAEHYKADFCYFDPSYCNENGELLSSETEQEEAHVLFLVGKLAKYGVRAASMVMVKKAKDKLQDIIIDEVKAKAYDIALQAVNREQLDQFIGYIASKYGYDKKDIFKALVDLQYVSEKAYTVKEDISDIHEVIENKKNKKLATDAKVAFQSYFAKKKR